MKKKLQGNKIEELEKIAKRVRSMILAMAYYAGGAHIAPAFSIADIITVLYTEILNFSRKNVNSEERDRLILSKGHACTVLYAILAEQGFIKKEILKKYCKIDGIIGGHPNIHELPGIEATTGSLGHGFSIACGVAFAGKLKKNKYKVYTILGDGESQEGTIWEASMFAGNRKLDNLIAIVDSNKLQGMGKTNEINSLEPFAEKWRSFNWSVKEINGNSISEILKALKNVPFTKNKPSVIIANTIKGKGVSFMEDKAIWHYRLPNNEEMKVACKELNIEDIEKVL
ncbi:MAG TPA: transketolase [Elusimicrobia bacterium]|nr:transketolase [Elusimicrobiota bacterium]